MPQTYHKQMRLSELFRRQDKLIEMEGSTRPRVIHVPHVCSVIVVQPANVVLVTS
ncbi:MAG: hypothetical protein WCA79_02425 [Anaerolineales bacterium]